MNYWIVRTFKDREAVGVTEGDIKEEIIGSCNGVHIGKVEEMDDGTFIVRKRTSTYPPRFPPVFRIEPVSESEYQTYKTFDLFEI